MPPTPETPFHSPQLKTILMKSTDLLMLGTGDRHRWVGWRGGSDKREMNA